MVNNIKDNIISEAHAKQKLNALNEIKQSEIKGERLISAQKEFLNLFDELLKAIFNNNNNNNNSNNCNSDNYKSESESGDEQYYKIKQLNNYFKAIDDTKSFEEQIEILKKRDFLDEYWHDEYYHDNKELNLRIFKAKAAHLDVNEDLSKRIFGQTFAALPDKIINTTSKEENQIIINDIKTNKNKIFEQVDLNNFVIHPGYKHGDLLDAVEIILEFKEVLSLDLA